jgi:hypothetical protein
VKYVNELLPDVVPSGLYWVERLDVRSGAFDPEDEEAL